MSGPRTHLQPQCCSRWRSGCAANQPRGKCQSLPGQQEGALPPSSPCSLAYCLKVLGGRN